jgi:hypothetical protein
MLRAVKQVLLAVLLLVLVVSIPFLHNHPAGTPENNNCPAYLLQITLVGIITFFLVYQTIFLPFQETFIPDHQTVLPGLSIHRCFVRRAPPTR